MRVFVIAKSGKPLMPTTPPKARVLLKEGKAKVVKRKPFTIQLTYDTTEYTQDVVLGVDSGYKKAGFSAITDGVELISGELEFDNMMSKRLETRAMYRRTRRNKLWYRQPRFNNRVKSKPKGWLPPSTERRYNTHLRLIEFLKSILPITKVIIEVGNFDIQKLDKPEIEGKEYQRGSLYEFNNKKAFIFAREKGRC
jgi:RRXRR protein